MHYHIGPRCSCCHYCFQECPVKAIKFVGTSYEIDEAKCIQCGHCAQVCPTGVCYDLDDHTQPTPHAPIRLDAEVVVLGAGGSGLVAAVRAAQLTGKKVVVLEKSKKPGGCTNLGHGFSPYWSKWHEEAGCEDTREQVIEMSYERSQGHFDKALLRKTVYGVGEMFDWMLEFGGWEPWITKTITTGGTIQGPMAVPGEKGPHLDIDFPERMKNEKSSDHAMGPGFLGTYVIDLMMEQCKKFGIDVFFECPAAELKTDDQGRFCQAIGTDPGGQVVVNAHACIIATGGFAHNDALFRQVNPKAFEGVPVKRLSVWSDTGDGMALVKPLDGYICLDDDHVRAPAGGPLHHPYDYTLVGMSLSAEPIVDNNGSRVRIALGHRANLDDIPNCLVYSILDKNGVDANGKARYEDDRDHTKNGHAAHARYWEAIDYESSLGYPCRKAWSLEELAEKIGCDPADFIRTIEEYNKELETYDGPRTSEPGTLGKFSKHPVLEPPFYAITLLRFNESASGGIMIDEDFRVRKNSGGVIPGIYAVGDSASGIFCNQKYGGGSIGELNWAMASGFYAGTEAAEYVKAL